MSREPLHSRVAIEEGGPSRGKPAGKSGGSRMVIYLVILVVAAGAAAYVWFGRDTKGTAPDPEAANKAAQIQTSQPAATTPTQPEMPVQGRPPRGAPVRPK